MTLEELALQVADLTVKYHQLQAQVQENTTLTQRVKIDTAKLVEFADTLNGATRFFEGIEKIGKPVWFLIKWVTIVTVVWQTGKEAIKAYFKFAP